MCLIIDEQNVKMKIANEDIVCYKLVKKVERVYINHVKWIEEKLLFSNKTPLTYYKTVFVSPYYNEIYEPNTVKVNKTRIQKRKVKRHEHDPKIWIIGGGVFHTFKDVKSAKKYYVESGIAFLNFKNKEEQYLILKCFIPKGTKYYDGKIDWHETYYSYASKSLKITDEIMLI